MGRHRLPAVVLAAGVVVAGACSGSGEGKETSGGVGPPGGGTTTIIRQAAQGPVRLGTSNVATGLDTPWSMAFDKEGKLWFTERPGSLRRQGESLPRRRDPQGAGPALTRGASSR